MDRAVLLNLGRNWIASLLLVLLAVAPRAAADVLVWDAANDRVDADIRNWTFKTLLQQLSARTGWAIYVEPGHDHPVIVRFKGRGTGEALKLLLGDLNFALLSSSNGPSRLLIYRTGLREATERIEPAPTRPTSIIPNELILTVKPGHEFDIDELTRRFNGKVIAHAPEMGTYRVEFPDEASKEKAREWLSEKENLNLDSNYRVERPPQPGDGSLGSVASTGLRATPATNGDGILIGLIDTAVQPASSKLNEFMLDPLRVAGESAPDPGQLAHGTSMAATLLQGIAAVAGENGESTVRILPVDVYGPNPGTTTFDVARGIFAALDAGADVINLSMGGDGDSLLIADLIRQGRANGVLFFGAAGNAPTTDINFPAAYPEVVAVTAADHRGGIAPYANRGPFVDVMAPGISYVDFNGQVYRVTGTSASTALVSGTAAALRSQGRPPHEVEEWLRRTFAAPVKP